MKKVIKSILSISMVLFVGLSFCHGLPFWVGGQDQDSKFPFEQAEAVKCDENTDLGNCVSINEDQKNGGKETVIRRLLGVFNIDIIDNDDHKFINYVKAILNVALGLLSMVALVMTIYTFYMMFFTENEAGAKKAKQSLIGIFIALAIIGLAWLIVSFIFRWYQKNWQDRNKDGNITINYELDNQFYLTA